MKTITPSTTLPSLLAFRHLRPLVLLAFAALATLCRPATAAPGDLDLTFGGTGKVTTDIGGSDDSGSGVVVQSDGKIILAGTSTNGSSSYFTVVRYKIDGSLDTSFNGIGKVATSISNGDNYARSVALQSDGKIVVAGSSGVTSNPDFAVLRYNTNGTLDTTFNGTGTVTTEFIGADDHANSVVIQSNGKIVLAGNSNGNNTRFALARYNANGSLDTSFNGTGKVTTAIGIYSDSIQSATLQSDGKIVVAGYTHNGSSNDIAVARYNVNGTIDTTFNNTGKVVTVVGFEASAQSVAMQTDGKIVVAGYSYTIGTRSDIVVLRYNSDGSLDTTFNGTGNVITAFASSSFGESVGVQGGGKIVVAGNAVSGATQAFALLRYNSNGSLDTTFNGTGKVATVIGSSGFGIGGSLAFQRDGRIVVAGTTYNSSNNDFVVVRYGDPDGDGDGVPDRYETGTGIYVSPENTGTSPTNPDTDGDGLNDGAEVNTYHSNPHVRDTDGDGFDDGFEVSTGFSPTSAASTPDALSTILTAVEYRFNAANGISYRIEASTDLASWTTVETPVVGTGGVITRFYSIEGQTRRYFRSRRN